MTKTIYNWKRFWCSRSGYLTLSPEGYLHDLELSGNEDIHDVAKFETISRFRCLVLLGEPGMGKTHAMADAVSADVGNSDEESIEKLFFDL